MNQDATINILEKELVIFIHHTCIWTKQDITKGGKEGEKKRLCVWPIGQVHV
jgi:hypothetical protein